MWFELSGTMGSRECSEVAENFIVPRDLATLLYRVMTCIENKVVGWESRMQGTLTERKDLSAVEDLRIAIQVQSSKR